LAAVEETRFTTTDIIFKDFTFLVVRLAQAPVTALNLVDGHHPHVIHIHSGKGVKKDPRGSKQASVCQSAGQSAM